MEGVESVIDLDVGGTRFRTSRQTLLSDPDSMLAKMFDPGSSFSAPGVKMDGAYFLDRDPAHFGAVLNYLRSGQVCNMYEPICRTCQDQWAISAVDVLD